MEFADFCARTSNTAIYPAAGSGSMQALTYVALGLAGESAEALEKVAVAAGGSELPGRDLDELFMELGDVAWHLGRFHVELGMPDPVVELPGLDQVEMLVVSAGRVAEIVKKALRDDDAVLTGERRGALVEQVRFVFGVWSRVVCGFGWTPGEVLAANIAKLEDRKDRGVLAGSGDHR